MDYALVVGIENYEIDVASPLQGPSLDALRFTLLLQELKLVPASNIILVHNKSDAWESDFERDYQQCLARVKESGVVPRQDASRTAIVKAWREDLVADPNPGGTLWIYWSGHGVTFPTSHDAVLCAGREGGDPSFIYLSELRDSLRSTSFRPFHQQRLIVDACAEYIDPKQLGIEAFRSPEGWEVTETPEQIEFSAVPLGHTARAEKGGSLFTRILLNELRNGWPSDVRAFYALLDAAIRAEASKEQLPRLRILSPRFEAGLASGGNVAELHRLIDLLAQCEISFDRYRPLYVRTMSGMTKEARVLAVTTLTAMLEELLQLKTVDGYGRLSPGLFEFFSRVVREFSQAARPLSEWLRGKVTPGAEATIKEKLDKEAGPAQPAPGFRVLAGLVGQQQVRDLVRGYYAEFNNTDGRLYRTADLKDLHEWLHKLHLELSTQLRGIQERFPASIRELSVHHKSLLRKLDSLNRVLKPFVVQTLFLGSLPQEMRDIAGLLEEAVNTKTTNPLEEAMFRLNRLLGIQMPRVDDSIARSANELGLPTIAERLQRIHRQLTQSGIVQPEIDQTAQSLFSLHESLKREIAEHNEWQATDNEIRLFEQFLRNSLQEIAMAWRSLKRALTNQIARSPEATWAKQLSGSIDQMDADLPAQNINELITNFVEIRNIAEEQFDEVDRALLEDCSKLRPVADDINLLLRSLYEQP